MSFFRTQLSIILLFLRKLPMVIVNFEYIAFGMQCLRVYLPYYQGLFIYKPGFYKVTVGASNDSTYWTFRTLQT
ncbi:C69 family dipeptidase, partial [Salmonella enterica subsp. enterica serovar Kentucky]|uniref:C69 family dipeptidase n=1 Tax=Salmonella enterica TaxID=28901 RepID=UPI003F4B5061